MAILLLASVVECLVQSWQIVLSSVVVAHLRRLFRSSMPMRIGTLELYMATQIGKFPYLLIWMKWSIYITVFFLCILITCVSMFVLLKGRTVKEAFEVGQQIASGITEMNPYPVTLKMEKVYQPCFLLTKKRYVGYSYESPDQDKPTFDAKGIETVRRDTCEAVAKTMEQSLRLFFEKKNISMVQNLISSPLLKLSADNWSGLLTSAFLFWFCRLSPTCIDSGNGYYKGECLFKTLSLRKKFGWGLIAQETLHSFLQQLSLQPRQWEQTLGQSHGTPNECLML